MEGDPDFTAIVVKPITKELGADVSGIDCNSPDVKQTAEIVDAFRKHSLLQFRGANITKDAFLALARGVGKIVTITPLSQSEHHAHPEDKEIFRSSTSVYRPGNSLKLHTDLYFEEKPPDATFLSGTEIPEGGGTNTYFIDMHAVYLSLPSDIVEHLKDKEIAIQTDFNPDGTWRQRKDPSTNNVNFVHRRILQTDGGGHTVVYLGSDVGPRWILGVPYDEGMDLLEELWRRAKAQERFRHEWRQGDLVLWDNWRFLHGRDPFDVGVTRVLDRITVDIP